jgi:hypothetical protein
MLQKRFFELTQAPNLKLLESQWQFDQKLIPKALQSVGQLFPHYSRHDQSHSEQILINIERVLGEERIRLLSATDIWLLLEAAYWHDIGMVIPRKALVDTFSNPDFQVYRRQVAGDNGHELQKFAQHFNGNIPAEAFGGADTPLDAVEKFRLFMAEWFRRQHATMSESFINDPWQELGISSPRTELIPKRLFRWLGRICAMHGATFVDVLKQLPHKEVGMATDDCHPRFIACLLRLGDLLDLDDNRFCPVLQSITGDDRPILSLAHEDKHRSIRNFRLNSDRIEIKAVCETVDGYVEQWRWLDYLKEEIQNQMARWLDIAPSSDLGLLPTLGEINVEIAGRQLITKPGKRQEFTLNSVRVMTLLRGENLYQREDVVRELLQNAVDATLLRVWLAAQCEKKQIVNKPDETSDAYFKQFPISVTLEQVEKPDVLVSPGNILWRFTVVDQGVGIGQTDLPYMMNVAGSSANVRRQTVIDSMPEWMQPSGTFGIGLQSIFMRTDEAQIKTKCFYTHDALDITLHSPTGPKRGLVTVEQGEISYIRPLGTTLSFTIMTDSSPYGHSIKDDEGLTSQALHSYDPLLDKEMPLAAWKIIDAVNKFAGHSLIPIKWTFQNGAGQEFYSEESDNVTGVADDFYPETNSKFKMRISVGRGRGYGSNLYYRGQKVKDAKLYSYHYLDYQIDLYAGKAGDWLTFDRNGLVSEAREKVSQIVRKNIRLWIERNKSFLVAEQKLELSLIAKIWSDSQEDEPDVDHPFWLELTRELPDEWMNLSCDIISSGKSEEAKYREILKKDMVICRENRQSAKLDPLDDNVAFTDDMFCAFVVAQWCRDTTHGIRYISRDITEHSFRKKSVLIQLIELESGQNRLEVDSVTLMHAIESKARTVEWNKRLLLPVVVFPQELNMHRLALREDISLSGVRYCLKCVPEPMAHVILPFEIQNSFRLKSSCKLSRFEEFIPWVHGKLKNPESLQATKSAYLELIEYIDKTIMEKSSEWKKLRGILEEVDGGAS